MHMDKLFMTSGGFDTEDITVLLHLVTCFMAVDTIALPS